MRIHKDKKRGLASIAAIGALGLALAGCAGGGAAGPSTDSGGEPTAGEPTAVRVAFTAGAGSLHVHIADKLGFFEDQGLAVELTEGLDLPTWVTALGSQYDMVMTTGGIFLSGADTFDLAAVGGQTVNVADAPENVLIVRGDEIQDAGDLAGKRVGTSTITGTTPLSVQYLVEQAGEDPASVTFVQVPSAQQGDQLRAGQVDAVVSLDPAQVAILEDPENRMLFENAQYEALNDIDPSVSDPPLVFYAATVPWAEENSDAIAGYRAALEEAIQWIGANEQEARVALMEWLGLTEDVAEQASLQGMSSTITVPQVQAVLDLSIAQGVTSEADAPDLEARVGAFE